MYCTLESHNPLTRNVWVDIRLESRSLHAMALEHRVSCAQILERAGVVTRYTPLLFVDGVRCHDGLVVRDGSVVTICRRRSQAVSASLGRTAMQLHVLRGLLRPLDLPRMAPLTPEDILAQLYRPDTLCGLLGRALAHNVNMLGLVPDQSRAIIASVAFGAFPVGCGSGTPADSESIAARAQELWHVLDANKVTDTKQVFNDCCVYLARESRSTEIFWFLIDQYCPDVFALDSDIDPVIGIPCPEGTAIDVVRRGPGWGIFRLVPSRMELRNMALTDQLDVNDLSSLDSQQTAHMLASSEAVESTSSGLSVEEARTISEADPAESTSLLQIKVGKQTAGHLQSDSVPHYLQALPTPSRSVRPQICWTSSAGETTPPVPDDALSGAQVVRRRDGSNISTEHDGSSLSIEQAVAGQTIHVWILDLPPVTLALTSTCSFAEVEHLLDYAVPQLGPVHIVPVFPPTTPVFQCLAFPRPFDPQCTVILLHRPEHPPQACAVWQQDTAEGISSRLDLPPGRFHVAGREWHGYADGCYHGMQVTWSAARERIRTLQLSALLDLPTVGNGYDHTERAVHVGASLEGLLNLLSPLQAANLCRRLPSPQHLHHSTIPAISRLVRWDDTLPLRRVSLFVDGSFLDSEGLAGWAVVAIGHQDNGDSLVGFAAGRAGDGCNHVCLSDGPPSAHLAELDALVFALGIAASSDGVEYTIFYDCVSAAGVATLAFTAHAYPAYASRMATLRVISDQRRNHIAFSHVRSHTGHPFNELADTLAKEAARGQRRWAADTSAFVAAFRSGSICHHWWAVTDLVPRGCLPGIDDAGHTIPAVPKLAPPSCLDGHIPGVPRDSVPAAKTPSTDRAWSLVVATYNVTSLCSVAEEQCVDACFHRAGVILAGLQETRRFPGERSSTAHYTRFSSRGDNGNLGCQLWVSKTSSPVHALGKDGRFCPDKAVIVHSEPRILGVALPAGGLTFGIVVCHALTSAATPEAQATWWGTVDAVLRKLPRHAVPLLLVDANARVTGDMHSPMLSGSTPVNHNAHCLLPLLAEHRLDSTPLFDSEGQRIVTWVAPSGHRSQIDYVLAPAELAAGAVSIGVPQGFVDHNGFDHKPMVASISWTAPATAATQPQRFDTRAMRSPAGQHTLSNIFRNAPQVSWATHPDEHVQQLNEFLFEQLCQHFPVRTARPRAQHISDEQWAAIRYRRQARRLLQRNKQLQARILLAKVLASWRAAGRDERANRQAQRFGAQRRRAAFTAARLALVVRSLSQTLRTLSRKDAAVHARSSLAEARHAGPAALASLLRGVMKSGRRYRAPRVQHVVEEDGVALADVDEIQSALERHFAKPEHGRPVAVPELIRSSLPAEGVETLSADELPSLADIAIGLQQLRHGKAPGASAIPSEAFSQAPLEAAMVIYPLFLKGAVRKQVPLLWRGTQAAALLKPTKPPRSLASWRNIALFDCCAKGIGAAVRAQLCAALQRVGTKGQHGALRHSSIGVPSHFVQSYLRVARSQKRSGAIVFLDGKSAYYSIIRQHLFPLQEQDDHSVLRALLASLHHDEQQQDAVIAAMVGPGLLAQGGAPPALIEYLRDSLDNSWFALKVRKGIVQGTATGSVPGTPTADVLFQFLQSVFMKNLTDRLQQAGLLARLSDMGEGCPQPAWADDVAVLAPFCSAVEVVPAIRQIVYVAEAESRAGGIELNFSAGKTEAIAIFRGAGSKLERRRHLATEEPAVQVTLASGKPASVRVVDSYVHLGCLVNFNGSCLADIRAKAASANIVFRRLKATLLKNEHLEIPERTLLVRSLVHSKLGFGAGLWVLSCRAEWEAFQHAFMTHWRQSCMILLGVGCKFLSDTEVCCLLRVAEPTVVYRAAKLRQLRDVLRHGPGFLWQSVHLDRDWLCQAIEALDVVGQCLHLSLPPLSTSVELQELAPLAPLLSCWASRYTKVSVTSNEGYRDEILRKARGLATLERLGGLQLKIPQVTAGPAWQCEICGRVCSTKAALAVHQSITHGLKASSHYAGGDTCQVCGVHWWTTSRLRAHVWRSPVCARAYEHADLGVPGSFEVVGHRRDLAWRPPVPAIGPAPWWSTLRPDQELSSPASRSPDDGGLDLLLADCGQGSLEGWARRALLWVCSHTGPVSITRGESRHAWIEVLLAFCQLKERQFCAGEIDTGSYICTADGHNIWLCPV